MKKIKILKRYILYFTPNGQFGYVKWGYTESRIPVHE
ncbi:Uncharacterised protein [Elizabethkingia miricola]|nr:Uncharacterised protein [Elizabethkingia miricola]